MAAKKTLHPNVAAKQIQIGTAHAPEPIAETADIRFPWKRVLDHHKFDAHSATPAHINQMKLFVGEQLESWLEEQKTKKPAGLVAPPMDPAEVKKYAEQLHRVLRAAENKMSMAYLSTMMTVGLGMAPTEETFRNVAAKIKAFVSREGAKSFSLVAKGPQTTVYRVADEKGKATSVDVPDASRGGGGSGVGNGISGADKKVQRFNDGIRQLGIESKVILERITKALGKDLKSDPPTRGELKKYLTDNA